MKSTALLAAALLLLTACAAPAPQESAPAPASTPENVSTPAQSEPAPKEVSGYYIESGTDGILDEGAAQTLCKYLWSNLAPKDYCGIGVLADIANRDPETGEITWCYAVEVFAQDKAPVDKLLQSYDGPWAPVYFVTAGFSRVDLVQAEADMNDFLDEHPDVKVAAVNRADGDMVVYVETIESSAELTAFVEEYPIQGVYKVEEYFTVDLNPD